MSAIKSVSGRAVPVRGNDIDTDRIIPARFLRCVTFDGLGEHAFEDDRAQDKAKGKVHPFDQERFQGAKVLLANSNFGCGSSREHAPQAIYRWGVRAIVAVSYSEIFHGNTVAMGMPCVHVSAEDSEALQALVEADPSMGVEVDLDALQIRVAGKVFAATLANGPRQQFLTGSWDATSELLSGLPAVRETAERLPYVHAFARA
jgi:3-isopropylmalate/(R)-2-methylmalate dehydratase small subunit